jgi:predicted phage terminase large subunit-like protein
LGNPLQVPQLFPQQYTPRSSTSDYQEWLSHHLPRGWEIPAHIQAIAKALDRVESGEIDRLLITMPPRHGKSETITVRLPLRFLQRHPTENVLVTGYNTQFARKFGRKTRNLADVAGILSDDKTASDEWATSGGGLYMARGVGSPPTGTGFGLIVIDDPVKSREEAESETYRNKVWDWYTDDIYTRLEPGGKLIIVMTRWHEDDLAGRAILSEPGWEILKLPAIAEEDDQIGRKPGTALWPNRYTVEMFERIRRTQGDYAFEALYQCNPTPREGAFFRVAQLGVVQRAELPAGLEWTLSWDLGATESGGDWTAGVAIAKKDGIYYVDPVRFQHEPDGRNKAIRQQCGLVKPRTVTVPQDPGAAGKESAQSLIRSLAGFAVKSRLQSGDKFLRAEGFAAQVNGGNVRVVEGSHARDYIEELRQAPMGKHDDMIDASSDAFNEIEGGIEVPEWQVF